MANSTFTERNSTSNENRDLRSSPSTSTNSTSDRSSRESSTSTLRDASDTMRDLRNEGSRIAEQASDMASDIYSRASTWMQGDSGRVAGYVAAAFAVGLVGYFIGRATQGGSMESSVR